LIDFFAKRNFSYDRWCRSKPYRPGKIAVEEKVGIALHSSTCGAMFIDVVGEPVSSGKCTLD
jgi:hypothetical protein